MPKRDSKVRFECKTVRFTVWLWSVDNLVIMDLSFFQLWSLLPRWKMFPIRNLHSDFGIFPTTFSDFELWCFNSLQGQIGKIIFEKGWLFIYLLCILNLRPARLRNNSIRRKPTLSLGKNAWQKWSFWWFLPLWPRGPVTPF